jgi:type VI protein secretion system component VasK
MTFFSFTVQSACLGVLALLLLYTLWLMRSGRLDAHVTVRWILAECAAILAVLLWGRLPFIAYTSALGDRELLVVLAVILFCLIAFLMLDCLSRISAQTHQIKRLTQELALLRESAEANQSVPPVESRNHRGTGSVRKSNTKGNSVRDVLIAIWILACICLYLLEIRGPYPSFLTRFFTADYLR